MYNMGAMWIVCVFLLAIVATTPSRGIFLPLFRPVFSAPRMWQPLQLPSLQPDPTFSHAAFQMPSFSMPSFPSMTSSFSPKCEVIANESDLDFPAVGGAVSDIKRLTFLCSDKSNKRFYFLKTTGKKITYSSHEELSSGAYYSLSKRPLELEKDLDVDKHTLWQAANNAEYEYNNQMSSPFGMLGSNLFGNSFGSLFSMPTFETPKCEKQEKNFVNVEYPKIDISTYKVSGDEITSHSITNETYLCSKQDGSKFYTLKTVLDYGTRKGRKFNTYKSVSYPLLSDGAIDTSKPSAVTEGSGASASMAQSSGYSVSF